MWNTIISYVSWTNVVMFLLGIVICKFWRPFWNWIARVEERTYEFNIGSMHYRLEHFVSRVTDLSERFDKFQDTELNTLRNRISINLDRIIKLEKAQSKKTKKKGK